MCASERFEVDTIAKLHQGYVRSLALRFAPSPGLAEDITQQVFLEFLAKQDRWDLESDVRPLLKSMTRNVALRHWRERTRSLPEHVRELAEHIRGLAAGTDVPWYTEEEAEALRTCLEQMPEKSKRIVHVRYSLGLNSTEIGTRLQMNAAAVRRALLRLREQLRKCVRKTLYGGAHA